MNKIVVPLDGSAFAEHAVDSARGIAARTGAGLEFVAVLEPLLPPSRVGGAPSLDPRLDSELRASRAEYLARIQKAERQHGTAAVSSVAGVVREGRAPDEIADQASTTGADLIVMTTHGRGGFERFWLGSVAEGVIRASAVPVLLVHYEPGKVAGDGVSLSRVVVGLAGDDHDDQVVDAALMVTDPRRATYTLVHVMLPSPMIGAIDPLVGPPLGEMAGVPASVDTRQDSDAERYLDRMARPFQQQQATVETRVLRAGGAGRSIVDVAQEVGADLIVVGTVGRSFLGRAFVGSVADKVVRRAECSVLVVPTKRRD